MSVNKRIFSGIITALITPFQKGEIDFASLEKLLALQLEGNVDGVVVAGSTGELSTLTFTEYSELVHAVVQSIQGRTKVIAGVGLNNTKAMLDLAREAENLGVDGLMCNIPYYNNPPAEGIYQHFKELHQATSLPIIIYSVPSRTRIDFSDELILRLAELPRIVAFKDAAGILERPLKLTAALGQRLTLLSGDDATSLAFYAQGGAGIISVASNIIPGLMKTLDNYWQAEQLKAAVDLHRKLYPLYRALAMQPNPIPVKYAASRLGISTAEVRMPLLPLDIEYHRAVDQIVDQVINFKL